MSKVLEIKYRCMHPSCIVNCREGFIGVEEELFKELSSGAREEGLFKSPKGICRLGFTQSFKVLSMEDAEVGVAGEVLADPIGVLMAEHVEIIKKLDAIEDQVRRRDIDALWASTVDLENDLIIHSGLKEEEVLFPALRDLVPVAETLVAIIKEDHREMLSLLHNFRTALETEDILDSIIRSAIVSLKGHIRKEDAEFFELVNRYLDKDLKNTLIEGFDKIAATHVPLVAGKRIIRKNEKRERLDDMFNVAREANADHCCNH